MFRKAVILLMLFLTPLAQARAVMICAMMDGQAAQHCPCPEGADHAAMVRHDALDKSCCDVVIEVSDKAIAGLSVDPPALKRVNLNPDDTFVVAPPAVVIAAAFAVAPPPRFIEAPSGPPARLYLRTARLRL